MFGIEYFVGAARGGWKLGRARFASPEAAEAVIRADRRCEVINFAGVFARRVAPA